MVHVQEKTGTDGVISAQRRVPSQQRSRERVERILNVATELIARKGSEAMHMSEVAEGAGISIGSLYQYFPDKAAIIRTLAERYNAEGFRCVAGTLTPVQTDAALVIALEQVVDNYYAMYQAEPVMRDIAIAMQSDRGLQAVDMADIAAHAQLLDGVLARLHPEWEPTERANLALLINQLIATTVRLAITLACPQAEDVLRLFKRLTLRNLMGTLPSDNAG